MNKLFLVILLATTNAQAAWTNATSRQLMGTINSARSQADFIAALSSIYATYGDPSSLQKGVQFLENARQQWQNTFGSSVPFFTYSDYLQKQIAARSPEIQTCPACPKQAACPKQEACPTCQICEKPITCPTCEPQKICPVCQEPTVCPACPQQVACPKQEACPTCPTCEKPAICPICEPQKICPACPEPTICPEPVICPICPQPTVCPACPTCPEQRVCPMCPTCPTCEKPTICPTCEPQKICPACPEQEACPTCPICEKQKICPTCPEQISQPTRNPSMKILTPEEFTAQLIDQVTKITNLLSNVLQDPELSPIITAEQRKKLQKKLTENINLLGN